MKSYLGQVSYHILRLKGRGLCSCRGPSGMTMSGSDRRVGIDDAV